MTLMRPLANCDFNHTFAHGDPTGPQNVAQNVVKQESLLKTTFFVALPKQTGFYGPNEALD